MSGSGSGSGDGLVLPLEWCGSGVEGDEIVSGVGHRADLTPFPNQTALLMALIGKDYFPLQQCGNPNTGVQEQLTGYPGHAPWDTVNIGPGYDSSPENYPFPGVGETAYSCQLGCRYVVVGDLQADVILAKIDGQNQIIKILQNGDTQPSLVGKDLRCRCCGQFTGSKKYEAVIVGGPCFPPDGCPYRVGDKFDLDPVGFACGKNPLNITFGCDSDTASSLEDMSDWFVLVNGTPATITDVNCCEDYRVGHDDDPIYCDDSGSGSGSGSGEIRCRFTLHFTIASLPGCTLGYGDEPWRMVIREVVDVDPCAYDDVEIDEVVAEACGLHSLPVGTRVIIAKIPKPIQAATGLVVGPGGPGCDGEPIEWFVVRACTAEECAEQCDEVEPPTGPPCCGKLCSESPAAVTATVEFSADAMVPPEAACTCAESSIVIELPKVGSCLSANVDWIMPAPSRKICETDPSTYAIIDSLKFSCDIATEECADGSGSGSGTLPGPGASFFRLQYRGGGAVEDADSASDGGVPNDGLDFVVYSNPATQCCDPLYAEFDIVLGCNSLNASSPVGGSITAKVTITA